MRSYRPLTLGFFGAIVLGTAFSLMRERKLEREMNSAVAKAYQGGFFSYERISGFDTNEDGNIDKIKVVTRALPFEFVPLYSDVRTLTHKDSEFSRYLSKLTR